MICKDQIYWIRNCLISMVPCYVYKHCVYDLYLISSIGVWDRFRDYRLAFIIKPKNL